MVSFAEMKFVPDCGTTVQLLAPGMWHHRVSEWVPKLGTVQLSVSNSGCYDVSTITTPVPNFLSALIMVPVRYSDLYQNSVVQEM